MIELNTPSSPTAGAAAIIYLQYIDYNRVQSANLTSHVKCTDIDNKLQILVNCVNHINQSIIESLIIEMLNK